SSDGTPLELAPLTLRQTAPDPEALVVGQCVLQAIGTHLAGQTDLLRFPRRSALLREERLGIGLRAQSALLPAQDAVVVAHVHELSHTASSTQSFASAATNASYMTEITTPSIPKSQAFAWYGSIDLPDLSCRVQLPGCCGGWSAGYQPG